MNYDDSKLRAKLKMLENFMALVPEIMGQEAENFYKDRFQEQGWRDNGSLDKWPRKKRENGYPGLRSKNTLGLVDTIRWDKINSTQIRVEAGGTNKPYAKIHNEGGIINIPVTARMRKFAWAMYYKDDDDADAWKGLALTKKRSIKVTIPRRQFMGVSSDLRLQIVNSLLTVFKRSFND